MKKMLMLSAVCCASSMTLAQDDGFQLNYIKKDTREETRKATIAQYRPALGPSIWHVCGPFDNTDKVKHNVVYPPELAIESVDLNAVYPGKVGDAVWKPINKTGWNPITLKQFGGGEAETDVVGYIYREVTCDRDAEITFEMGSDDGLKFWFNGRLLVDADLYRGLNTQDHQVTLDFKKGDNYIFAKVTQGVGGWDFQMRPVVDPRIEALVEYHLNIDFPTPEARHYRIITFLEPEDVVLEVGGLDVMVDGRPMIATRRGEIWIIDNAYDDPPFATAKFTRFAFGLHEPLGLRIVDDSIEVAQRQGLVRLTDRDGDDHADDYEIVSDQWGVSGNYHEFAFGPKFDGQGNRWVTLNLGFCGSMGKSVVPWRGWAMIVNVDGSLTPVCGGLRSPNGLGANAEGDMFYTDNQGDWVGTNKLSHLDFGDFHGHPGSDRWYEFAGFPLPSEADFKPPAVWFPYGIMGQSASDIALDDTDGAFGPFTDQLFVGDQTTAVVMRVFLEKVDGEYQGACFPFREGFDCGVNRLVFAQDGSLFVGMTNRGWGSLGRRPWGVQRLVYTGELPFEILEMRAAPDGFELSFTKPIDPVLGADPRNYKMSSYTYERWEKYGSDPIDEARLTVSSAVVAADGMSVRLTVDNLRAGYVHALDAGALQDEHGESLLHAQAWYTLNRIP